MRILFDQGTPAPLRRSLPDHQVSTVFELDWSHLKNGELLKIAEESFDLLITTDQNLGYQQNLTDRKLAILVLPTTSWPVIQRYLNQIAAAVEQMKSGRYRALDWPR